MTRLTVLLLLSSPALFAVRPALNEGPAAAVPFSPKAVTLDGKLSSAEWSDAAVLYPRMRLNPWDAFLARDTDRTKVYVKHDDRFLWVGVDCIENMPGYPEAEPRKAGGNFTLDDCVQVVLGLVDRSVVDRGTMDMGGYDGAMGTPAVAADNYYQFIVNSVGANERTWNELPLKNARFESAVARTGTGWSIEYKIPFTSFGAPPPVLRQLAADKAPIFFNVIRCRPPQMVGWWLPGFGNYKPMPFGKITLLDAASGSSGRTFESAPQPSGGFHPAARPDLVEIGYYPLSGSVIGIVDGHPPAGADRAVLTVTGLPTRELTFAANKDRQLLIAPITAGSQPARHAKLELYASGKLAKVVERDLAAVTAPEWFGTQAGEAYVHDKIPTPWTRPQIDGRTISLVDKTIRLGAFGLFDSIRHGGAELLADPAEIDVVANGKALRFSAEKPALHADGNEVRVESAATAGAVKLETRALVDYDGFTVVKLRLSGVQPEAISKFAVRIPLRADVARYVHRVLVQNVMPLDKFGFEGPAGPLWAGDEDHGLSFASDTPVFFSKDVRRQVRLVADGDRTWMELNFVDGPGELDALPIFRFILQPTPTKPEDGRFYRPTVTDKWERWSDWQGYPDLAKLPELKEWGQAMVAAGRIPTLYTCQGLSENAPYFKEFKEDFVLWPEWIFYRRHGNPDKGAACYATSKRGPEGDLQLWAFKKLADEADIGGILSDGLSMPWDDDNPGHARGGGQPAVVTWDADFPSKLVAQRTFLKRLRGIFCDTGRPLAMSAHTGGGLDPHTLSFFDYYIDGEQLSRFPAGYQPPLASYAIGYSGVPWGLRGIFWTKRWVKSGGPFWTLTYALLHDNEVRDNPLVQQILDGEFGSASAAEFHPYWRPWTGVAAKSATGDSRVSTYLGAARALVVAGNPGLETDVVTLDLRGLFPGGMEPDAVDVLTGKGIGFKDGRGKVELPRGRCAVLRVRPANAKDMENAKDEARGWTPGWKQAAQQAGAEAPAPFELKDVSPDEWSVGTASGVTSETTTLDGKPALAVRSTAGKGRAVVTLGRTLGDTFSATLVFDKMPSRIVLRVGEISLKYDGRWVLTGPLDGWSRGMGPLSADKGPSPQPKVAGASPVRLVLSMKDGRLDAVVNGQLLVRGVTFDLPRSGNRLSLDMWAGAGCVFRVERLSSEAPDLFQPPLVENPVL